MKKRAINVFTIFYVSFAIIVAHTSLAAVETPSAICSVEGGVLVSSAPIVFNNERLYQFDAGADQGPDCDGCTKCKIANYRVEAWTATWCGPCERWKQKELPTLLKAGLKIAVRDVDDEDEPDDVNAIPTIRLYYKDKFIKQAVNWKANALLKFIEQRKTDV